MNLRIVLIVLFFYCGQCLSAQNEMVRYIKPLDNFNRVEQIIVKNENFLKSLHPDVCEFTIHDNYLYYISANNNSIIRFDIKNGNSKILKNGALERYYSYIYANNTGTIDIIGGDKFNNQVNFRDRVYNIYNNYVVAVLTPYIEENWPYSWNLSSSISMHDTIYMSGAKNTFCKTPLLVQKTDRTTFGAAINFPSNPIGYSSRTKFQLLCDSKLLKNYSSNRFCLLFRHRVGVLKFFDIVDGETTNIVECVIDSAEFNSQMYVSPDKQDTMLFNAKPIKNLRDKNYGEENGGSKRLCAIDAMCDNNSIFVLYNEKITNDYLINSSAASQGDVLYEFDWYGNLIQCHKLEHKIYRIMHDAITNKHYGISLPSKKYRRHILYELIL